MPVLESTDHLAPKSAIRHRPIAEDAEKQGKGAATPGGITPVAERASRLRQKQTEEQEDVEEWKRSGAQEPTMKRGRASAAPSPSVGAPKPKKLPKLPLPGEGSSKGKFAFRLHPMLYLGIGMIVMLALWTLLTLAISWWN